MVALFVVGPIVASSGWQVIGWDLDLRGSAEAVFSTKKDEKCEK